jgi:hypothetical protein
MPPPFVPLHPSFEPRILGKFIRPNVYYHLSDRTASYSRGTRYEYSANKYVVVVVQWMCSAECLPSVFVKVAWRLESVQRSVAPELAYLAPPQISTEL